MGCSSRRLAAIGAAAVAVPAAALTWALIEAESHVLRRVTVPVLPTGSDPVTVLHLSDLHLRPAQRRKVEWVSQLADLEPDFVVTTGDNWASERSLAPLGEALAGLLQRPGAFVLGSNDYHAPRRINPLRYLMPPDSAEDTESLTPDLLPVEKLRTLMTDAGWIDLNNARSSVELGGLHIDLVGTDDAHIGRDLGADQWVTREGTDVQSDVESGSSDAPRVKLAVTHAPYQHVLREFQADGADLVLAGHTHGGQICVPGYGALVTNCDLDRSMASGMHRWSDLHPHDDAAAAGVFTPADRVTDIGGNDSLWLHVSAGLGTAPSAPIRLACRPEATLLTLTAAT